jgi:hypothetical protein
MEPISGSSSESSRPERIEDMPDRAEKRRGSLKRRQDEKVHAVFESATEEVSKSPPQKVRRLPVPELPAEPIAPSEAPAAREDSFTPQRSYRLLRSPSSGSVRVPLTPRGKEALKRGSVLYRFKQVGEGDEADEKRLIGFSDQANGRLRFYIWGFNHPEEERSQLARDVHAHPERFEFGVIRSVSEKEDPKQAETEAIVAKDSIRGGYNKRKGGGGGRARGTLPQQECPYSLDEIVAMIREDYESPLAKSMKRKGGKLVPTVTESDKKKRNVVYEFLFDPTEKKEDRIHHVGYTTTTLSARMSAHKSSLNDPESRGFRTISLYSEILAHPEHVKVRVFNVDKLVSKGIPVWALEAAFMQFFAERGESVRNMGAGGKGAVSHDSVSF